MKNIRGQTLKVIASLALSIASAHASAAIVAISGKITRIGTGFGGEGIYIAIDTPLPTTCPSGWTTYMPTNAVQYRETVAIAMAAQAQGKQLMLYYDNSVCPQGSVPTLVAVALVN